ncbi:MAG TPA: hypothetical protein VIY48_02730 [Candidatus Paceibacterota bacterium]
MKGWIGVDLDGTLAKYDGWRADGSVGEPILKMAVRVKRWLAEGKTVKIVTARACLNSSCGNDTVVPQLDPVQVKIVQDWCETHLGARLPVVFWKDYGMIELWDDRAVQVYPNTGTPVLDDGFGE